MDRCDLQYAVKECARGMARPTVGGMERLKRVGRYLLKRPRYVMRFGYQKQNFSLNCFSDSDWAGDLLNRNHDGRKGNTAYENMTGRPWEYPVVPFGEKVMCKRTAPKGMVSKVNSQWAEGLFVGMRGRSAE